LSKEQREILAVMLSAQNDTRGGNSWGVFDPDAEHVIKGLGDIVKHWKSLFERDRVMCHTRLATTGDISVENAHPFVVKNLVGAHNGVISNHEWLNTRYGRKCDVDSEHIFQHLADGLDLDDIDGYGAIEWVDRASPDRLLLCRLTSWADLAVAALSGGGVIWSSDELHLKAALLAADISRYRMPVVVSEKVLCVVHGKLKSTEAELSMNAFWGYYSNGRYSSFGSRYDNGYINPSESKTRNLLEDSENTIKTYTNYDEGQPCGSIGCSECYFLNDCSKEWHHDD